MMITLLLLACGSKTGVDTADSRDIQADVTWVEDVAPIFADRCAGCHDQGLAPFSFSTWDEVEPLAPWLVSEVEAGRMPPWPFQESTCREVAGSLGLTEAERAAILAWRDAGYARGEGEPDLATPEVLQAPRGADLEVHPDQPFTVDPSDTDPYWCAYVSAAFADEVWVEGTEMQVDDDRVNHHAFLYAAPEAAQVNIDALDAADPLPGFRCDGGLSMAGGVSMLGGWAPGAQAWWPSSAGPSPAMRLPAGSRLVVEVHYNTSSIDAAVADTPGWAIWLAADRPRYQVLTVPVADASLAIPPLTAGWVETARTRLPIDATLVGTAPHMHALGQSLTTTLTREDGEQVCLTDIDGWNFHWQYSYALEGWGLPVGITDQIAVSCTFDNDGEGEVGYGERTEDEMCLDYLTFVVESEPDGGEGTCGDFTPCFERCEDDDPFCALTCLMRSGDACYSCGADAMFGDCTLDACGLQAMALDECTQGCADLDSDYAGCLYDSCAEPWADYEACWRASFEDGSCASDAATCAGMSPG